MKKTNKKGFTLIELLAVIVILAIIIVMAVASVGAVLNRMKKNAYVVEANTIVKALKNEAVTDTSILPTEEDEDGEVYIPLSDIELQNGTKSPYGSAYDESSYVKIVKGSTTGVYTYSICIVDTKGNGIPETNIDEVTRTSVTTDVECSTEPEAIVILSKGVSAVDLYLDITGGWSYKTYNHQHIGYFSGTCQSNLYNGYYYPYGEAPLAYGTTKCYSNYKIDVSDYKKITVVGYTFTNHAGANSKIVLGLKSSTPTYNKDNFNYFIDQDTGIVSTTPISFQIILDVSQISGEYYVVFEITNTSPLIYNAWFMIDYITLSY